MVAFALLIVAGSFNLTYTSCPLLQLLGKLPLARRLQQQASNRHFTTTAKGQLTATQTRHFCFFRFTPFLSHLFLFCFTQFLSHTKGMIQTCHLCISFHASHSCATTKFMIQKHHAHAIFGHFVSTFFSHTKYRRYKKIVFKVNHNRTACPGHQQ